MGKTVMAVAFLALIGAPVALAQSGTKSGSPDSAATNSSRYTNSAPIGHRQPRRSDVPDEQSGKPLGVDPAEAALDRKIKSICRGC
ncbi:MAG: hypothetical protein ACTHN2_00795 [Nitrobacter sp.]|jgi:hypothetical protein